MILTEDDIVVEIRIRIKNYVIFIIWVFNLIYTIIKEEILLLELLVINTIE